MTNEINTDYHTHTTFSMDARSTPEQMCVQALSWGLKEIAFTEHAEWHNRQPGFMRVEQYFEAVEKCRKQFGKQGLRVLSGVELGNPHIYSAESTELLRHPFEMRLASLHWLYGVNIHDDICFRGRSFDTVVSDYFTELEKMVLAFDFDIVAHFDRILWRPSLNRQQFDLTRTEDRIRQTFATIIRHGRILELNTKVLNADYNWNESLITMLRWFAEEGGREIAVNSDAHERTQIARNRPIALSILAQAGLTVWKRP